MRFTRFIAFLAASAPLISASSTLVNPLQSRSSIIDVCVDVKVNLAVELNKLLGITLPDVFGNVDICLCVGALPVFIQANVVAQLAVILAGQDKVLAALAALINTLPGNQHCTYPPHYQAICAAGDPCGFTCKDGYTKQGNTCVCDAPKHECNGQCQVASCPVPSGRRRSIEHEQRMAVCPRGFEKCGVFNNGSPLGRRGWECLETRSNLESCGGCTTPLHGERATGKDCTTIPNASTVGCNKGACVVDACKSGWVVDAAKGACIPAQ